MKVSYNWLQNYFSSTSLGTSPLPSPEKLAELLTFHVFEIESLEKIGNDTVLDVKVLPDRARYALSHKGIAYEIGAILNIPQKIYPITVAVSSREKVSVTVEDSLACPRYMARKIEGVTMAESPEWLKKSLEVLGQRSINSVVDVANLTLLDLGQPLHIFDADKLEGVITVRFAKAGEKITTLDNKEIILDEKILVIADDVGPLVIAGIKGGHRAEVTSTTKNIIIESANFNASLIRKTTMKVGIRTDASKRYENAISPDLCADAMEKVTSLIQTINTPKSISEITDIYPKPVSPWTISTTSDYISARLGISLHTKIISDILHRLDLVHELSGNIFTITIPTWRGDLTIPEDIVEEIGRIYGYDKIPTALLPETSFKPNINKEFYYANKMRNILVVAGYSEVYTYSLQPKGDIEILNPLASDKNFLRSNLTESIENVLSFNLKNADLLALDSIKIFEIGTVFAKKNEYTSLAIGILNVKSRKVIKETEEGMKILNRLEENLKIKDIEKKGKWVRNVFELNFTELLKELPEPKEYDVTLNENISENKTVKYQPISQYPFAVRDIAVFVPAGVLEQDLRTIIEEKAGKLLVRTTLFDVFQKQLPDGTTKTSYAFRLVLQSHDKTLTEEEINSIMNAITLAMNAKEGWGVR